MRPYNKPEQQTKGISGRRRSCDSAHRKRCLRVDKRAARREAVPKWDTIYEDIRYFL